MNDTTAATLTEEELFAKWREKSIIIGSGGETYELNANNLVDYEYDDIVFDPCLTDTCGTPSEQLFYAEVALETALDKIRLARRSFDRFRNNYDEQCEPEFIDMTDNGEASTNGSA